MKSINVLVIQSHVLYFLIFSCLFIHTPSASERFINNNDGTISDTETGLMWISKDNGVPINWFDAKKYCQDLNIGGYSDWRMPTLAELATVYDPNEKNKNGYHIISLISTTAQSCWSSETRGHTAGRFNFTYGKEYWLRQMYSGPTRVLAVRNESATGFLQYGSKAWQLADGLETKPPDLFIRKTTPDSFLRIDLKLLLRKHQIKGLVICGMHTEFCVDTTTRKALAMGFPVILVSDAHTSAGNAILSPQQVIAHHNITLTNISSFGPRVITVPSKELNILA